MKRKRKEDQIFGHLSTIVIIGCICIVGGIYLRSLHGEIVGMFRSGKYSVPAWRERAHIRKDTDFATDKERYLFNAIRLTNEQCIGLSDLEMNLANLVIGIGLSVALIGSIGVWRTVQLKKQIAESGRRRLTQ